MASRYEIREKIGQGGVGAVYKAFDTQLKREVALKRLLTEAQAKEEGKSAELTEDLLKEATTLSALQHPNIVTVYDVGKDEDGPFVVMELLRGETFDETIQRGALPLEDFKLVVTQTLEAMIAAQALDVVHRDLKPGNLMVIWLPSGKFQLKILDFGLAKFGKIPTEQTADQDDGILGSIFFMAPEQFERIKLDARTDMYALGCIYYYALTGKYPFHGEHAPQVMASHLQNRFTPLMSRRPDLPIWLCDWVEWLVSREMRDRPVNAKEAFDYFHREEAGGKKAASRSITVGAATVSLRRPATISVPQPARAPTRLIMNSADGKTTGLLTGGGAEAANSGAGIATQGSRAVPGRPGSAAFPGKKSHFPKWAKLTIPLLLVVVVSVLILNNREPDVVVDNYEELRDIIESEEPLGNADTARLLMEVMKKGGHNGLAASSALFRLKGEGVDSAILNSLPRVTEEERVALIGIIVEREISGALVDIAPYLADKHSKEVRDAAVYALDVLGGESEIPDLLDALAESTDEKTRSLIEQAVIQISSGIKDDDKRSSRIRTALASASGSYRLSLLRILCDLGGERAWSELLPVLRGSNKEERKEVLASLGNWPDFTPGPELFRVATESTDPIEKVVATGSLSDLLARPNEVSAEQKVDYVGKLLEHAKQNKEKLNLLSVASQLGDESALALVESFADDPQLGGTAKAVAKRMAEALANRILIGDDATLPAKAALIVRYGDINYDPKEDAIVGWNETSAGLRWTVKFASPGRYDISVVQAANNAKNTYRLTVAGQTLEATVKDTGSETAFEAVAIGSVVVPNAGTFVVEFAPRKIETVRLLSLRSVKVLRTGEVEAK